MMIQVTQDLFPLRPVLVGSKILGVLSHPLSPLPGTLPLPLRPSDVIGTIVPVLVPVTVVAIVVSEGTLSVASDERVLDTYAGGDVGDLEAEVGDSDGEELGIGVGRVGSVGEVDGSSVGVRDGTEVKSIEPLPLSSPRNMLLLPELLDSLPEPSGIAKSDGDLVGDEEIMSEGELVGDVLSGTNGISEGALVGDTLGDIDAVFEGVGAGVIVGNLVGDTDRATLGDPDDGKSIPLPAGTSLPLPESSSNMLPLPE